VGPVAEAPETEGDVLGGCGAVSGSDGGRATLGTVTVTDDGTGSDGSDGSGSDGGNATLGTVTVTDDGTGTGTGSDGTGSDGTGSDGSGSGSDTPGGDGTGAGSDGVGTGGGGSDGAAIVPCGAESDAIGIADDVTLGDVMPVDVGT
jgi:hypothetical protein